MYNWKELVTKFTDMAILYAPKVLMGLATLVIGMLVVRLIVKLISKTMVKSKVDESLQGFLTNIISLLLRVLVLVSVASMLGIKMTSFIAILSAMAFAVGLALQGSLANFAGGVLIILFKPFKVGDYVEAQGHQGVISTVQIFHTVMKTVDNKTIIIPNGPLSNGNITNYTSENLRRVDFSFGIGYNDDLKKAKEIIMRIVGSEDKILKSPAPFARLGELGDSSVNITVRVWAKTSDYWDVYFDMMEAVKASFDSNKISIPYPQTDVHLYKKN